jgi:Ca2+-binding RTX toxin-like protein
MPTDGDDVYYGDPDQSDYYVDLGLGNDTAYISSGRVRIASGADSDEWGETGFSDWDVLYADFSGAQAGLHSASYFVWELYITANYSTVIYAGSSAAEATFSVSADTFDQLHVTGSQFDDQLVGGGSDDFYFGGAGNDSFAPLFGNDFMDGGRGSDWLTFDVGWPLLEGAQIDLGLSSAQPLPSVDYETAYFGQAGHRGRPGMVTLRSVENIQGTDLADNFIGTSGANQLLGMGGDDRLVGLGGNDILDGGPGADVMRGGVGDDIYFIDHGNDRALEYQNEGTDLVYSSVNYSLDGNVERLTLTGSAIRGNGNSLDNRIIGNHGDNIINGGAGADSMRGGLGNDRFYVDNAGDRVVENAGEGVDRVYSTVSYSATLNVDQVFLRGTDAIDANGNALDNVLVGNSAANILNGRLGADDLRGGGGADTFYFANGHFGGLTPSTCDRIIDFSHTEGDRIDLGDVDANGLAADDQAFAFLGTGAFTNTAGELRYQVTNGNTYVYGDTDGDGIADFMIRLDGIHALVSGDFVL